MSSSFKQMICSKNQLNLIPTLNGGQSFRWKQSSSNDCWIGVFYDSVWKLKQGDNIISYINYNDKRFTSDDSETLLKTYFRMDIDLVAYYKKWCTVDVNFKKCADTFQGIRILKQDLIENLFAFICSSNNNIQRIKSMVEKLCEMYGEVIATVDGNEFYSFPQVESLCDPTVEEMLRKAGFGYRAKFIHKSACLINEEGVSRWKERIQSLQYDDAKRELMKLPGIGAKVADCICLMSLGHLQAVPVDTHVFQIAKSLYMPHLQDKKTVTEKIYNEIADHFRNLYGDLAGWAHTVLFCADLKIFKADNNEIGCEDFKHASKPRKRKLLQTAL